MKIDKLEVLANRVDNSLYELKSGKKTLVDFGVDLLNFRNAITSEMERLNKEADILLNRLNRKKGTKNHYEN